jgi:hypothetical protein
MFDKAYFLAMEAKNKLQARFMRTDIGVVFDKERGEYFICARDKDLYYSKEYGMLAMEISRDLLERGATNFYFILDSGAWREFDKTAEGMSFYVNTAVSYAHWDIKSSRVVAADSHADCGDFSLAA